MDTMTPELLWTKSNSEINGHRCLRSPTNSVVVSRSIQICWRYVPQGIQMEYVICQLYEETEILSKRNKFFVSSTPKQNSKQKSISYLLINYWAYVLPVSAAIDPSSLVFTENPTSGTQQKRLTTMGMLRTNLCFRTKRTKDIPGCSAKHPQCSFLVLFHKTHAPIFTTPTKLRRTTSASQRPMHESAVIASMWIALSQAHSNWRIKLSANGVVLDTALSPTAVETIRFLDCAWLMLQVF